ncbi:LADA_0G09054g1_1 [Lachancea dasiensis]|uniref:M-phase inducer phosphatase n=1 Tax=Lachancea dasiensis TaxID=1072105 RepID=A0A1G4JUM9_9SACH|nr:LADA_0G09054g1_1 [Lachancea dasiensis]
MGLIMFYCKIVHGARYANLGKGIQAVLNLCEPTSATSLQETGVMSNPKGLVKRAKNSGLAMSLQEGGSFLKSISLLKGMGRKPHKDRKSDSTQADGNANCDKIESSGCLFVDTKYSTTYRKPNLELETQSIEVSSAESSPSCDEDAYCISPVVKQAFPDSCQPSMQGHLPSKDTRKPKLRRSNSGTASTTLIASRDTGANSLRSKRQFRGQQHGIKKDSTNPQGSLVRSNLRRIHSMYASQKEFSQGYSATEKTPLDESQVSTSPECPTYQSRLEYSGIRYHIDEKTDDKFPRIDVETLVEIMDGGFRQHYQDVYVVDCRFEYEYRGGHIGVAININSQSALESKFIHNRKTVCTHELPPLIIFHCEFSSYRGPIMASHLRNCDRVLNYDSYPKLHYPDILIVDGGYKSFFDKYQSLCFPRRYIGMDSQEHIDLCEAEMEKFRINSKRIVTRANSFQSLNKSFVSSRSKLVLGPNEKNPNQTLFSNNKWNSSNSSKPALPFPYEAPPKLSLSHYCDAEDYGSPTSLTSSNNSSGPMFMEELRDDTGSTDLDNISLDESNVAHPFRGAMASTLAFKSTKRSLFGSILKEEDDDNDVYPNLKHNTKN